jgi:hypothetical protein
VIECLPTAKALVVKVAVSGSVPLSCAVPSWVEPSRNMTVPVGVPDPGGTTTTVAVNVTL